MNVESDAQLRESLAWVIRRDAEQHTPPMFRKEYRHLLGADAADALRQCETDGERRRTALRYIRGLSA